LLLSALGCKKAEPEGTVLAQVEQSRLTLEEVRESFPPEFEKILPREQYLDFIQRWIDDEIVYQVALKRKLEEDPKVRKRLENMRRKVILEEFLAREGAGEDYEPDEGAMTRYYEMHTEAFRRQTPEFRYVSIRVESMKEALALRTRAKNEDFLSLAAENSTEGQTEMPAAIPFRKPSEIPSCLLDAISSAKPGNVLTPVACPDGVHLVKLLEREAAGSLMSIAEAKDAIGGQLAMEHRDRMREAKIRKYKEGMAISYNLDQIPGREDAPATAGETASAVPVEMREPKPERPPPTKPSKPKRPRRAAPAPSPESPAPGGAEPTASEGTHPHAPSTP
jgi:hypothetical protein